MRNWIGALFVLAVFALSAPPALAAARSGGGAGSAEGDPDWTALERELEWLAADLARSPTGAQDEGPRMWGYVRASYANSSDYSPPTGGKLGGFVLDNVRWNVEGESGDFAYRVTMELQSGALTLEDAYLRWSVGEELAATLGQFKQPFLQSGLLEANRLLFIVRTRNGLFYSVRDQGAQLSGDHGRFHWAAAAQNGVDSTADELLVSGRVEVDAIGPGALEWEGAHDAGDVTRCTLGLALADDGALPEGGAVAVDASLVHRGFSLQAELVDYDQDYDASFVGEQRGGTTPWSVTASYALNEDYELAVRWDDFDDAGSGPLDFDRQWLSIGVDRYVQGHDIKWQLQWTDASNGGDDDGPDAQFIALGLTLSG